MGGASPTFKYCDVAHVSARTRPSPSLYFANFSYGRRPGDEANAFYGGRVSAEMPWFI